MPFFSFQQAPGLVPLGFGVLICLLDLDADTVVIWHWNGQLVADIGQFLTVLARVGPF